MKLSEKHIPELDGVRGIAVMMVLVWHFVGSLLDPSLGLWAQALNFLTIFGRTGVDLFFVLSGFLIIGILVDNRDSLVLFRTFFLRRAARIVPPYLLLIAVYWTCYALTGPNAAFNTTPSFFIQLGAQSLFAFNWLMAIVDGPVARGFAVTWSVAIEEQFYLIFPFIVWLTPQRYLRRTLITVGTASALARMVFFMLRPEYGLAAYVLTPFRLDCLCAGGVLATIWRDESAMRYIRKHRNYFEKFLIGLALIALVMLFGVNRNLFSTMHVWGHAYLSIFYSSLLLAVLLRSDRGVPILLTPLLQFAGRLSYGLYLFHPLLISLVFVIAGRPEAISTWADAVRSLVALALTILLCIASYALIEHPFRRWAHRASYFPPRGSRDQPGFRLRDKVWPFERNT